MKYTDIRGIIVPILTPMDENEQINLPVLREQIERMIVGGVNGIFPLGTNGEAYILSEKEKLEVLEAAIDQVAGRVPVYAGTGCISTAETIRLSKAAQKMGADVLSIITPSFAAASQHELYEHYTAIARQVDIPIVLYNIPARTGNKLLPETVQKLAKDVDVILGAKDSSGDFENLSAYIRLTQELDKDFRVLSGNDALILPALKIGGFGGIAGCANVYPKTLCAIYTNFIKGDLEAAQQAQDAIASFRSVFRYGNPNTIIKKAVSLDYPVGDCRRPFNYISDEGMQALKTVMQENRDRGFFEMANVHVKRPIIGISMGDPFGNGPEITVSALSDASVYTRCRPLVVGDYTSLSYACRVAEKLGRTAPVLHRIESVEDAFFTPGTIDVLDLGLMPEDAIPNSLNEETPKPFGVGASKLGGEAAFQYVKTVIELAMQREIDATVTNAISKEAINMAGHHYSGHTEIYAHYTNTSKYTMMLAHDALRVVHVSTHVSLREACDRVKTPRVLDCIRIANNACKALGIETPKIAVAGLNPHCGENGMFGDEEINEIQPAIDLALAEGICIPEKAPTSPDSVFSKALGGWFDIVVAMYHDQGHIPLKVKGFVYDRDADRWQAVAGVNVTLGLPIIRASVDHGTGFGHAGNGCANALSLNNAMDYAIRLANNRKEEVV